MTGAKPADEPFRATMSGRPPRATFGRRRPDAAAGVGALEDVEDPFPRRSRRLTIETKLLTAIADPHDAPVIAMCRGQTVISPALLPLLGPLIPPVHPRVVAVSERSVLTLEQSRWSESTVRQLISEHPRGAVDVHVSRWGLRIGDEDAILVFPSMLQDMHQVARAATVRGRSPASL